MALRGAENGHPMQLYTHTDTYMNKRRNDDVTANAVTVKRVEDDDAPLSMRSK